MTVRDLRHTLMVCVVLVAGLFLASCGAKAIPEPAAPVNEPTRALGDTWTIKEKAILYTTTVIAVLEDGGFTCRLEDTMGDSDTVRYSASLGVLESMDDASGKVNAMRQPPAVRLDFPLFVGKQWSDAYTNVGSDGGTYSYKNSYEVKGYETVKTAAGEFAAFRIGRTNYNVSSGRTWHETYWYAPEVGWTIKGNADWGERWELTGYSLN